MLISSFIYYQKDSLANSITIEGNAKIKDSQITTEEYEGNVYEKYDFVPTKPVQFSSYLPQVLTGHEKFINRRKELPEIERNLAGNQIVVITGRGGIGKSSCAIEYGRRYKNNNDKVACYINADSGGKIDQAYQEFAKELNINVAGQPPSMIMRLVHNKLVNLQKEMLFIFDNVQQYDDIKDYLVNLPPNVKLLITARQPKLIADMPNIALEEFDDEAAREYLECSLQNRSFSEKDLQTIIHNTGTLPYDLRYTSAHVLNNPLLDNEIVAAETGSKIKGKLFEEFATSNDKLKQHAWKILQYASYLDPDFIDIEIIKALLPQDENLLYDALKRLESLSLISIIIDKNDRSGIKIHRKLQKSIQYSIRNHPEYAISNLELNNKLFNAFDTLFPIVETNPDIKWQIAGSLLPHIKKLLDSKAELANNQNKIAQANLCYKLAYYYRAVNVNYRQALAYARMALNQRRLLYKDNHPDIANALNIIGRIYVLFGNNQEALEYLEEGLRMRQRLYSRDHPDVAESLGGMGRIYLELGELQKGLEYAQVSLAMNQRLYSGNHAQTARSLNLVGTIYFNLGSFKQSLIYFKSSLQMFKALYTDNHNRTASLLNNVAYNYHRLGNYTEALKNAKAAVDMGKELYPKGNPELVCPLRSYGAALIALNRTEEGMAQLQRALAMSKNFDMGKHFITAFVYYNLGIGYFESKDYRKALEYAEKSLSLRQEIYATAKNHIEIIDSLHSLGDIHLALGNRAKASEFYNEALAMSMTLSLDHLPETRELREKIENLRK